MTFCHVHHMNVMRTWTFCGFSCFCFFSLHIPSSCFIASPLHIDFSLWCSFLFLLPPALRNVCLSFCPSVCLSVCLGCVWPCLYLPLQEVVSRLIESRLRSLELNTCSEELLFNCSSHSHLQGCCWYTHKKHIRAVFDLTRSHSLVLAFPFCCSWKRRDE